MIKKLWMEIVIFSMVISLLATAGCSRDDDINKLRANIGAFINIPAGEMALISTEKLYVKFDAVTSDSRCPTGVACIRAGEATAKVQMKLNGETSDIILTDNGGTDGMSQSTYNLYKLTFQIKPYPKAGVTIAPEEYILNIKIDK